MTTSFDLTPFLGRDEGQHFDRKSMFEGEEGKKRPRDRRKVRDQVAEQVAGFANAEGGVLILGIEDDHEVTGYKLPPDALAALLDVPKTRLHPPQPPGFVLQHGAHSLIVFDVPTCDVPVRVEGDGFPLRIGDKTVQVSESYIRQLKFRGLVESWESRPSHLRLPDLEPELLERARRGAGLIALTDEEYLLKRKLADHRGRDLVLRQGAELLFAKNGPDHPNAGFRLFRVVGTERKLGAEHNVEERPRFEGNRPTVIEDNARLRAISGLDTLGASALLRRPRDRDLLALHAAGPNSYYELGPKAQLPLDEARDVKADRPKLTSDRPELEADRTELPPDLVAAVKALGARPRQGPLRDVIAALCPLKPAELGALLGIRPDNLTKRHLAEMVAEGRLRRLYPDEPTHPNQAYAAPSGNTEESPT